MFVPPDSVPAHAHDDACVCLLSGGLFRRDRCDRRPRVGPSSMGPTVMTRSPRRNTPLQRGSVSQTAPTAKPDRIAVGRVTAVSREVWSALTDRPGAPMTVAVAAVAARRRAGREHLRRRPAALGDRRRLDRPGRRRWWPWSGPTSTSPRYEHLRRVEIGPLSLEHWAADGALAIFFFVAGLELKRELLVGSLRRPADAAVPVVAALLRRRRPGADLRRGQPGHRQPRAAGRSRPRPTSPSRSRSSPSSARRCPLRCAPSCSPWPSSTT